MGKEPGLRKVKSLAGLTESARTKTGLCILATDTSVELQSWKERQRPALLS